MKKDEMYKVLQKGSLMVEALALLGLITMVTPVMYKKAAERTTELQDINIATQMRTLNEALDNYVRNNYEKMKTIVANDGKITIKVADGEDASTDKGKIFNGIKSYLPAGFDLSQSKYFDANNLQFSIKRKDDVEATGQVRSVYTSAVMAPAVNSVKYNRASKIASMIGVNGGTYKDVSGKFEGTQGAWNATPADWFDGVGELKMGSLMSISNEAIAESAQADTSKLLYRVNEGDQSKNTMKTTLFMDGNDIDEIKSLFGVGGNLTIGKDVSSNLIVNGLAKLMNGVEVIGGAKISGETETDTLTVNNGANVGGDLDVGGEAALGSAVVEGDLDVGGETTLGVLHAGATDVVSLAVTNDATVGGALTVTGLTTLGELKAGASTLDSLTVTNDATVGRNLSVGGTLSADKLHANSTLSVGGDATGEPSYLKADATGFWAKNNSNMLILGSGGFEASTSNSALNVTPAGAEMRVGENSFVNLTNSSAEIGYDSIKKLQIDSTKAKLSNGQVDYIAEGGNATLQIRGSKVFYADGDNKDTYVQNYDGRGKLYLNNDQASLSHIASANGTADAELTLTSSGFKLNNSSGSYIMTEDDDLGISSNNLFVDVKGLTLGNNAETAGDGAFDANGVAQGLLTESSNNKVVISRQGYIDIAPPSGTDSGLNSGFIRARRLVSDVAYPGGDFDGFDNDGEEPTKPYQYYEVNPAYTSVMNDIKLASRGGARLSDILPDYVIKGIYVADNTYHAGKHFYDNEDDPYSGKKLHYWGDALNWDAIPINNGYPMTESGGVNSVIKDSTLSKNDVTDCIDENNCKIYTCESTNCVASPWMGFIPRPQCPHGYQAVVTSNPIRWRMSEIYYLKQDPEGLWDKAAIVADKSGNTDDPKDLFASAIGDLNTIPHQRGQDAVGARFSDYFARYGNPIDAYVKNDEVAASADGTTPHTHALSHQPATFQTNTWLNSSVSPHLTADGADIDGWHMLMGFLYTSKDYADLLSTLNLANEDPNYIDADAIYWNLFPVYAQDMASIVTTYCSFNRREYIEDNGNVSIDWKWNADSDDSPVLDYDQLDPNYYRNPLDHNRYPDNPATDSRASDSWFKAVTDPTLPYNDAW